MESGHLAMEESHIRELIIADLSGLMSQVHKVAAMTLKSVPWVIELRSRNKDNSQNKIIIYS
jgi:hypothetical protein